MRIPLAAPSYTARSLVAAAQETMNWFPEPIQVGNEPAQMALYGRSGLKLFKQLTGAANIRCLWSGGGRLFCIHGITQSEIKEDGTQIDSPGTLAQYSSATWPFPGEDWPTLDPAQIFSNGSQLMIVSGGKVYCDNGSGPVQQYFVVSGHGNTTVISGTGKLIRTDGSPFQGTWNGKPIYIDDLIYTITGVIDASTMNITPAPPVASNIIWQIPQVPDPAGPNQVTGVTGGFLDGYFIVARPPKQGDPNDPGRQFCISKLYDGTWWDPLDFGVKEGRPDYIHSILCDHEELWLFGTESTECWTNVGDPNFPFQRQPGAFIHEGSSAVYAPCSVGLAVCGLASGATGQPIAFKITGLQTERISTYAQEQEWSRTGFVVTDATSFGYTEFGHTFWILNFWTMGRTWVYDLTTGLWHERATWSDSLAQFQRYLPWFHAYVPEWGAMGKHIVGDPATGKLYQMSMNFTDDDGLPIKYRRAFPHLLNENQYLYHHRMEVLAEMGTMGPTDPVPQIALDWSDDYGNTFGTSRSVPMGPPGQYKQRAVWRRLGKGRGRVPRIAIEANVKIALIDAYLESTPGFA